MATTARSLWGAAVLAAAMALAGCEQAGPPYLEAQGGSFIFNYRLAQAYAGVMVVPRVHKTFPKGSIIEVSFQDPAGGPAIVMKKDVTDPRRLTYSFETPALRGIKANTDYTATIRLIGADGGELDKLVKIFRSDVDESVLPKKPPVIGPGYTRNPDAGPDSL